MFRLSLHKHNELRKYTLKGHHLVKTQVMVEVDRCRIREYVRTFDELHVCCGCDGNCWLTGRRRTLK